MRWKFSKPDAISAAGSPAAESSDEKSEAKKTKKIRFRRIARSTSAVLDVGLLALYETADAFPPLKSVVGGLKVIVTLAQVCQTIEHGHIMHCLFFADS